MEYEVVESPVEDLIPSKYNPRKMTPQAFQGLKVSLRELGWLGSFVVANEETKVVVGGHQRLRAWKELGHETVPTVFRHFETDAQEKAANLALNNQEIAGHWDKEMLVTVLTEIKADDPTMMAFAGFQNHEYERFKRQVAKMKGDKPVYELAAKMQEHYDYVVIFCDNETDFAYLRTVLGVTSQRSYKKNRKGIGRVIPFRDFARRWEGRFGNAGPVGAPEDGGSEDVERRADVPPDEAADGAGA